MGFEELPHTADWSIRVWANDLPALFAEAARSMNTLSGVQSAPGPRRKREFEIDGSDSESLLVTFLSEILYAQEDEETVFDTFDIQISGQHLSANLEGDRLRALSKPIKAVTFHDLHIQYTKHGCETTLVFDV